MIQIENRAEESDDGEDDDHAAYYLIDNDDAVGIKLIPNLVDEPGESEPPQQGSEDDAEIPYSHFYRHIRYDESKHFAFLFLRKKLFNFADLVGGEEFALYGIYSETFCDLFRRCF